MADPAVPTWTLTAGLLLAPAVAYGLAVLRLNRRGDRWPRARNVACLVGVVALAVALLPPLGSDEAFPAHVLQHLLLAMLAPLCLALSAPVTLALRVLPASARRLLVSVLHSRIARVVGWGPLLLVLEVGGMYLYYLTPLFELADTRPALHVLVHAHMFLAGLLLSWYVVARDPVPGRPGTGRRLLVLFLAAGCHDLLAKLMYAHLQPAGGGTPSEIRAGAQLMFYGGDLIELLLAAAVMTQWYARSGRQLQRERRRSVCA